MIEVENIYKSYNGIVAVNGISLNIQDGEFVAITGRSGSGKSTLLKCMSGLLKPTSGNVKVNGKNIFAMNEAQRSMFRNKEMGFVFQSYALEPKYTGYENIEIPLVIGKICRSERRKRIDEISAYLELSTFLNKPAELLSGGEKQRIAIGRAIANNPGIIFADEPCGNLDKANSDNVIRLLKNLSEKGITVVMVTHQNDDAQKADRIIQLLDGQII